MRIVIELKRDAVAGVCSTTCTSYQMQTSFGIIMLALVATAQNARLASMLQLHRPRRDVITRRTRFELRKAKEREHILEGLKIALDHIDEIVRPSAPPNASGSPRQPDAGFSLSEKQAQAILDMRSSA